MSPPVLGGAARTLGTPGGLLSGASCTRAPGDKGGDANIGLWAMDAAERPDRVAWLTGLVTPDLVKRLLPEAEDLHVEVFALPNLGGVNVLLHGLLGEGVAASSRFDPQAKALGEWIRSRHVDIPEVLL